MTGRTTNRGGAAATQVADHAAIELRRVADVLQVDHVSLFLPDPDALERSSLVAETGLPLSGALPEHASVVERVMATGRVQELHADGRSALATPLLVDGRAVGALLVVTLRGIRSLGLFEAQVLGRATETLVARIAGRSDRFSRD